MISGKACIHVTKPSGATGVSVYKESKLIKTLTKSNTRVISCQGNYGAKNSFNYATATEIGDSVMKNRG